jgi:hypothetical protein
VPAGIPGDCHRSKATGRHLGKPRQDVGEPFVLFLASRRPDQLSPLKAQLSRGTSGG